MTKNIKHRPFVLPDSFESLREVVNSFKDHFSRPASSADIVNRPTISWINVRTFFFLPVTEGELIEVCCGMKNKFSSGHDSVPVAILRRCIGPVATPICHIFNSSVQAGIFPELLKLSEEMPLYKKGDPNVLDNYRKISILSSFSKLFEVLMSNRLVSFF